MADISSNVSVPTAVQPISEPEKVFFGRRKITLSLKPEELTAQKIAEVLPQVLAIHEKNANEIDYLYNYYKGRQPILWKDKAIRPEINNKVLENHAFEIVEFKKAYVYGSPVQYVQKGEKNNEIVNPEISILNKFMESEDKSSLDKELAEWQYICGTAYRWTETDTQEDEDDAPFEMSIPDPRRTFVVYSSDIKGKPLFSGHYSYFSEAPQTDEKLVYTNKYRVITVYTDSFTCKIKENLGNPITFGVIQQQIPNFKNAIEEYPLAVKGNRIIEYPLNSSRLGLIELVITGLNALNRLKSANLDDIEQFVQSLLVFINQDATAEDVKELIELGAVKINTSDPSKPADLKMLAQQLSHEDAQVVANDIYNNILTICGIPRMNDKPSGGDTGQARLLGEGWTMADERAKQDELSFKKSERQELKLVLNICKYKGSLETLKISDIDIKFTRNKSDNLLVKTQGLMNMQSAQVPPDVAFTVCDLFSDPNDVYTKAIQYYGGELWKQKELKETDDTSDNQKVVNVDSKNSENNSKANQSNTKNISANEG